MARRIVERLVTRVGGAALAALGLVAGLAGGASAVTLKESDVAGGAFGSWSTPTVVAAGTDVVQGTGNQNQLDVMAFTGLGTGAQTLSFDFSIADYYTANYYRSGGRILYSMTAFDYPWDHDGSLGFETAYNSSPWFQSGSRTSTAALNLDSSFAGTLYLALAFTDGSQVDYRILVPARMDAMTTAQGEAFPTLVPVPAGMILLGTLMGGLSLVARLRRPA